MKTFVAALLFLALGFAYWPNQVSGPSDGHPRGSDGVARLLARASDG